MKVKKSVLAALALTLSLSAVACNQKETTPMNNKNTTAQQNTTDNTNVATNDYVQQYSRFYGDNIGTLSGYQMYSTPQATTEYYKNNQYPGNKKYVEELKAAYKDSRDKIQKFVNDLKNDAKTDDKKVSDLNQQLINEGEKTISNIDARLKNLDNLPKDAYNQGQDDFIQTVNDTMNANNGGSSTFNDLLNQMNQLLGISPEKSNNNMNNNNNNNMNNKDNNMKDQNKK